MRVFIDEVILKLVEMKKDGYCYCDISEYEAEDRDIEIGINNSLCFVAEDDFGLGGIDYEDVEEVPDDEIAKYAVKGKKPCSERNVITSIEFTVRD